MSLCVHALLFSFSLVTLTFSEGARMLLTKAFPLMLFSRWGTSCPEAWSSHKRSGEQTRWHKSTLLGFCVDLTVLWMSLLVPLMAGWVKLQTESWLLCIQCIWQRRSYSQFIYCTFALNLNMNLLHYANQQHACYFLGSDLNWSVSQCWPPQKWSSWHLLQKP